MSNNTIAPPTPRDWIRHIAAARTAQAAVESLQHEEWEVRRPAREALEAALNVLSLDFELAPWGPKKGGGNCFVTTASNAYWDHGAGEFRQLFIQRRRVATWLSKTGKVTLVGAEEAEAAFQRDRGRRSEYDKTYKAERELLIMRLVAVGHRQFASFGDYTYEGGLKGGFFYRLYGSKEVRVAAMSAIEAAQEREYVHPAAVQGDKQDHLLEMELDRQIHGDRY